MSEGGAFGSTTHGTGSGGSGSRDRFTRPNAVSLPVGFGPSSSSSSASLDVFANASTSPAGSLGRTASWYWDAMQRGEHPGSSSSSSSNNNNNDDNGRSRGAPAGGHSPFGASPSGGTNAHFGPSSAGSTSSTGSSGGSSWHARYKHVEGVSGHKLRQAAESMRAISTPSAGLDVRLSLPTQRRKGPSVSVTAPPPSTKISHPPGFVLYVQPGAQPTVSDAVPRVSHSKMLRAVGQMRNISTPSAGLNVTVQLPPSVLMRKQQKQQARRAPHHQSNNHRQQQQYTQSNQGEAAPPHTQRKVSPSTGIAAGFMVSAKSPQRKRMCRGDDDDDGGDDDGDSM